jgi:glycosyltransferase involved in cell wall biosynthesis
MVIRRESTDHPRVSESPCPRVVVDSDDWEGSGGWNDDPRASYSTLQRRFFAWQERYGLSHADAWTVTSECLRQRAVSFRADPSRVFNLHNGTVVPEKQGSGVRSQESGVRSQETAVLYSRFAGTRPADVAEIWARVRERAPNAALTVVGRGLGGEERELVGLPGITVQGWIEPAELPALLGRTSVAIVPWGDTPPNRARHSAKVLELMAAGLPIVAYAVGELPATLGGAGVLASPGDADAFAAAVSALLADPDRATRLGRAARARVQAHFTWQHLADLALAAYRAAGGAEESR